MAKTVTFLAAANATLKRVNMIAGSSAELTSFVDSARQHDIDVMIQCWNEVLDQCRPLGAVDSILASGTLTLVTSTRAYSLPAGFVRMAGNPVNATNSHVLIPYPDNGAESGFLQYRIDYADPTDYQGQPAHWMINPVNGTLDVDSTPTSDENGDAYTYVYDKAVNLTATSDTFPFDDEVVRALYPAVSQVWHRDRNHQFDEPMFNNSMAQAARMMRQNPESHSYGPRRGRAR